MEITDDLCQALQRKSQDVLNVMNLVSTTKSLLQIMRDRWCDVFFKKVKLFYENHEIDIPEMNYFYRVGISRDPITIEHHF